LALWPITITSVRGDDKPTDADAALVRTAGKLFQELRIEKLDNGLTVYLLPVKGSPIVTTMLAYKVGSADEEKDQTGLSHYLEHLLFKGTDKLKPGDIDRITQRNGGRNNAYTSEDMTVYHFDFAADRWKEALAIEADRIRNTRIDAKHEFQQEKGAVISELKGGEDQPWELENKAILPLLFGKEAPYSHPVIGEEKHVRAATAEIIKRHYDKWYHPNNASLIIAGGFDSDEAITLVKKLFGGIPKEVLPDRRPVPELAPRMKQVRKEIPSKFDVSRMTLGFNTVRVGTPDDYVLDVLDDILATGKTSRLYRRLVEGDQLANSVASGNYSGRYPGWFSVQVEMLKGKDRAKAEAAVFDELKKLAAAPVTPEELKRVRRRMLASFLFSRESIHSLADLIARSVTYQDVDYLKTYLEKVMAVTPEDIQKAAGKYLAQASSVVVWSVPEDEAAPKKKDSAAPRSGLTRPANARQLSASPRGKPWKADPSAGGDGMKLSDAKTTVLPNGLTIITLENRRLPIVVVETYVADVGLYEPAKQAGIAALVGDMLEEGTPTKTGAEIATLMENTGGSLSMSSSGGSLKVLTPDTDLGLGLLFDCLIKPTFPADALERKRDQLLSVIADMETQPQNRARRLLMNSIYGDHPFGRSAYGKKEIVEKLTVEQCKAFHAAHFAPNRTTVVVVGDFDTATIVKQITELTKGWKPVKLTAPEPVAPLVAGKPGEQIVSDPTAAQTHVYIGHLGIKRDDPDYYKLLVMDNVLGTGPGFTDRLSATLRDRQGLAYTVNAQIAAFAGAQPGTFLGYIGTFADKYTWVREGFLKEIHRIRDEKPTDQEVDDAKKYLLGSLPFKIATTSDVAAQLLAAHRYKLGFDFLDKYRKELAAVTPADVQAVAKKHLDPKKLTIIAVGPIDKNGKPLAMEPEKK